MVLGLGPVGLACIAELKMLRHRSDRRRGLLARAPGARRAPRLRRRRRPAVEAPIEAWRRVDGNRPLVIFEAVGVPGHDRTGDAHGAAQRPRSWSSARACSRTRSIPMLGIGKELNIQFVLGYDPLEFGAALDAIAEGQVDLAPLITGFVVDRRRPAGVRRPRQPRTARQDPRRAAELRRQCGRAARSTTRSDT